MSLAQLQSGQFCLASKDAFGHWVNAADQNVGGTRQFVFGPYNSSYPLGTYGVDTSSQKVWAVVNHDGDFAAKALSDVVNFVYTSDNHYGITRPFFQGGTNVPSQLVNEAMIAKMNALPGLSFPNDGGVGAGQTIGQVDFLITTGDIANRTESQSAATASTVNYLGNPSYYYPGNAKYTVQQSAATWSQFQHDYLGDNNLGNLAGGLLTLTNKQGLGIPVFISPGNHDVSDAIGMNGSIDATNVDATSFVQIYNRMTPYSGKQAIANNVFTNPASFTNVNLRVNYSFDIGGVHVMVVNMFPDKNIQQWMTADMAKVPYSTPTFLFCHAPVNMADGETKIFGSPTNTGKNNAADVPFLLNGTDSSTSYADLNAAKQSVADWLMGHPNVRAMFAGHDNFNGTTNWNGQNASTGALIDLRDADWPGVTLFRVDSPMKGNVSGTGAGAPLAGIGDETKLSFQVYSLDIANRRLTEREYLYNNTANPNSSGAWSVQTTTIDLVKPVVGNLALTTDADSSSGIAVAKLLQLCQDLYGSAKLSGVSSTSVHGGVVTWANGLINYAPPAGYTGADSFTFTVTNSVGSSAQGTVNVTVVGSAGNGLSVLGVPAVGASNTTFNAAGIPGFVYQVQGSTDLANWANLGWATAGSNGLFQFVDVEGTAYPTRFYRTVRARVPTASIAVFSDPHYMDPSLLVADGTAFQAYMAQDRKLLAQSKAILETVINNVSNAHPNIVLVPGDLTKDGELVSHLAVSNYLATLKANGAKVFVCPGNHDVNNPHAVSYDGSTMNAVPTIQSNDFAAIYAPFGFADAIARDSNSLSYVVEPVPGLQILAMDACHYERNTNGAPYTGGYFDTGRWNWITNQLALARSQGKFVIGMVHHGVMEHYQYQKSFFPDYVLDNYPAIDQTFANYGMKVVLTGHYHAQDVVRTNLVGGSLFDIETGSTVTYPCPYRFMTLSNNGVLNVTSLRVTNINYDLGGQDFQTYAYNFLTNGLLQISAGMLMAPPYNLPSPQAQYLAPALTEAFISHYQGDETTRPPTPYAQSVMATLYSQAQSGSTLSLQLLAALQALFNDPPPSDNNLQINLINGSAAP